MCPHHDQARTELLLPDHHARLDRLLTEVISAVATDDRPALHDAWGAFEDAVLAHLAAEETYLLPGYAEDHPAEAAAIQGEHGEIRALLADLGVSVDLKRFNRGTAGELAARLRAHGAREDADLYPWAAQHHEPRWRRFLDAHLRRASFASHSGGPEKNADVKPGRPGAA